MNRPRLYDALRLLLNVSARHRYYPLVVGLIAVFAWYATVSVPSLRQRLAAEKWYPANFAGWDEVATGVREELAAMPAGTALLADNFKLGAELGFKLGDLARDGRLGDMQGAGGGGNAAPLRDRAEVFKLANGHGNAPPDKLY